MSDDVGARPVHPDAVASGGGGSSDAGKGASLMTPEQLRQLAKNNPAEFNRLYDAGHIKSLHMHKER